MTPRCLLGVGGFLLAAVGFGVACNDVLGNKPGRLASDAMPGSVLDRDALPDEGLSFVGDADLSGLDADSTAGARPDTESSGGRDGATDGAIGGATDGGSEAILPGDVSTSDLGFPIPVHGAVTPLGDGRIRVSYDFEQPSQLADFRSTDHADPPTLTSSSALSIRLNDAFGQIFWRVPMKVDTVEFDATIEQAAHLNVYFNVPEDLPTPQNERGFGIFKVGEGSEESPYVLGMTYQAHDWTVVAPSLDGGYPNGKTFHWKLVWDGSIRWTISTDGQVIYDIARYPVDFGIDATEFECNTDDYLAIGAWDGNARLSIDNLEIRGRLP